MQRGVPVERLRPGATRGGGEVLSAFSPQVKRSCMAKCWRWITPCPKSSGERGAAGRGGTGPCICTHAHTRGGGAGAAPAFTFAPRSAARGGESERGGEARAAAPRARGRGVPVPLPTFHPRGTPRLSRVGRSAPLPNEPGESAVCPGARRGRGQRSIAASRLQPTFSPPDVRSEGCGLSLACACVVYAVGSGAAALRGRAAAIGARCRIHASTRPCTSIRGL